QFKEYDLRRQRAFTSIRDQEQNAPGAQLLSQTIFRIITSKKPRLRYLIGTQERPRHRDRQKPVGAIAGSTRGSWRIRRPGVAIVRSWVDPADRDRDAKLRQGRSCHSERRKKARTQTKAGCRVGVN